MSIDTLDVGLQINHPTPQLSIGQKKRTATQAAIDAMALPRYIYSDQPEEGLPPAMEAPPEIRLVRHLGHYYFVVFKDYTLDKISDVWIRDFNAKDNRRCIWSHATGIVPTPRIYVICRKAVLNPIAQ